MMNIGIVDVDGHHFPNFALMRASAYHKAREMCIRDRVETIQVCLLTVCVVDFNAVCYDRDNSSLPT